jgi:hypothetical protein
MDSNRQFERLKQKYASVLRLLDESKASVQNLNIQEDKLLIRVAVPTQELRDRIMAEINRLDPTSNEVQPDIRVQAGGNVPNTGQTNVAPGNEFSKPPEK